MPEPLESPQERRRPPRWFPAAALIGITLVAYLPVLRAAWIWDDDYYVTRNYNLRSFAGLVRLWTVPGAVPQYYPLTHTSFWIEYHLWGLWPAGYHLDNVLLHAASGVLLWVILRRLRVPGAWVAAAVFAVHPVHVESVAWVTERKNVLSATLCLLALLLYLPLAGLDEDAATRPAVPPSRWWRRYVLVLLLFAGSLLAKSVTASLPAAIVLLIWWRRGRVAWADLKPLLPMFVMGAAMGAVTSHMERTVVGAQGPEFAFSFADRVLIAGRAVWFYAMKLVWPARLTFIYPRWHIDPQQWWQWAFPAIAVGVVLAAWALRHRVGRGPVVALLLFGGVLFPALGFVNVFPMRYSFVADHFAYLASIPLIVLIVGAVAGRLQTSASRVVCRAPAGVIVLVLVTLTFQRGFAFADAETLWRDTVAKNPAGWMPRLNYGKQLMQRGDLAGAERQLEAADRARPDNAEVLTNLGALRERQGRPDEAIELYRRAVTIRPDLRPAAVNLAQLLIPRGELDEADALLQRALAAEPPYAPAYRAMGTLLQTEGRAEEALKWFARAGELDPDDVSAQTDFATALARLGRLDEAESRLRDLVGRFPGSATTHNSLGLVLAARQQYAAAEAEFKQATTLDPKLAEAFNNLGAVLELKGDAAGAVAAYERALVLRPTFEQARRNLARARAAAGMSPPPR